MRGKPFVLNTHGSLLGYKKYLKPGFPHLPYRLYDALSLKRSAKRADRVVVSSKFEYEDAIEFGIDKKKLAIIPAGLDFKNPPREKTTDREEPLKILFVGRIARVRRVELLLQAVRGLAFPWQAVIVGGEEQTSSVQAGGYLPELKTLSRDLGIEDRVSFAGPQKPEALAAFYEAADVFVYPSLYENFGQPMLEAAAAGLPLVATPVGVARELVQNGETGFLTDGDPKNIRQNIERLRDNGLRRSMGKNISKLASERYNWNAIIQQYLELYRSL